MTVETSLPTTNTDAAPEALDRPVTTEEVEKRHRAAQLAANNIIRGVNTGTIPVIPEAYDFISDSPGLHVLVKSSDADKKISKIGFDLRERYLSGAADSAHGVIMGDLRLNRSNETENTQAAVKVYQKRDFFEKIERVQREVFFTRLLHAYGGEITLEPLAVAVLPDKDEGTVVLITKLAKQLYSLDNIEWDFGLTDDNITEAIRAADTLGRFNSYGIKHGDAKIKNVATQNVFDHNGAVQSMTSMIDFETSKLIDLRNDIEIQEAVMADFGLLVKSLIHKKFLRINIDEHKFDVDSEKRKQVIEKMLYAYLANWELFPESIQNAVYEVALETLTNLEIQENIPLIP